MILHIARQKHNLATRFMVQKLLLVAEEQCQFLAQVSTKVVLLHVRELKSAPQDVLNGSLRMLQDLELTHTSEQTAQGHALVLEPAKELLLAINLPILGRVHIMGNLFTMKRRYQ